MKRTKTDDGTQDQNGQYGRLPVDLIPTLQKCSHLEVRVFAFLSMLANYKREPLGMVECESFSSLAKTIGIPRKSLYRAIERLQGCGLVTRPGRDTCVMVTHYLCHQDTPPVSSGHTPVSSGHTKSPQPQPFIEGYEPPIRSEEVSEEEVKRKRKVARALELKAVAAERKDRAAKAAPPHPLSGLVSWDKEKREVRLEEEERSDGRWCKGKEALRNLVGITANREKLPLRLTNAEWQEGWGRLNGHLMGNPFKTNPKTLPAIVLNWFETDLRRKNNHPQRGKPLAQRIDDKARERMNHDGEQKSSTSLPDPFVRLLKPGRERYNR